MKTDAAWNGKLLLAILAFSALLFALGCPAGDELSDVDADVDADADEPADLYDEWDEPEYAEAGDFADEDEVCEEGEDPATDLDVEDLDELLGEEVVNDSDVDLPKEHLQHALSAIEQTRAAVGALLTDDEDRARDAVDMAVEELEELVGDDPEAALVHVDDSVKLVSRVEDAVEAERLQEEADRLLDEGDVRGAMELLDRLVSEAHRTTVRVPVDEYLQLLRQARDALDGGRLDDGRYLLEKALDKIETVHRSLSLPVLEARKLFEAAVALSTDDPDAARELLVEARERVRLAELLDHVDESGCAEELGWDLDELIGSPAMDDIAVMDDARRRLRTLEEQSVRNLNPDEM